MVGFENNLVQVIIMTKQYAKNKKHIFRSKVYVTLCIDFSETCAYLPITWSSMLKFINNVAQISIMRRGCVASERTFVSPSAFSRRAVVSYWRKYVHEVLVNRLGGLSLPRKSVVR